MSSAITRTRSPHDVGEDWTVTDASEAYEIARWGKGYFSIGENGHVIVHPTKDAARTIDTLKDIGSLPQEFLDRRTVSLAHIPVPIRRAEWHDAVHPVCRIGP